MKTSIAILFLAMFMATNCASVPSQRRLGLDAAHKAIIKKVLHAGIDLIRVCATAELTSRSPEILKKLGVTPAVVVDAIAKLADKAVDHLIKRRRRLNIFTDAANKLKNAFVGAASAVANAAKTAQKGFAAVAGPMAALAGTLNKLSGGKLAEGLANLGCPALIKAIQAGIAAQFAGLTVPGCVTEWFTAKCKEGIAAAFKRARLLRRLSALRRDILNF
jgi:hypothetical protein